METSVNNKCKAFTSLEQSRKLAEILPLESADMHYNNASIKGINYVDGHRAELMDYDTAQKVLSKYLVNPMFGIIPCWSLAALLGVLPKRIELELVAYELSIYLNGLYYWNVNNGNLLLEVKGKDNLVDACVDMIEKLHELKML